MEGGDISNNVITGRTLVHARTFTVPVVDIERGWFGLTSHVVHNLDVDLVRLAEITRASLGLPPCSLVTTDDDYPWGRLWESLQTEYAHPFRSWLSYESDQHLASSLSYMPNTRVIDLPGKAGVYGSRFLGIPW